MSEQIDAADIVFQPPSTSSLDAYATTQDGRVFVMRAGTDKWVETAYRQVPVVPVPEKPPESRSIDPGGAN